MAESAEVYVTNGISVPITIIRQFDNGTQDVNVTLANGNEQQVDLVGMDMFMLIHVPETIDLKECKLDVKSDIDLSVAYLRSSSNWRLRLVPNTLAPTVPTTVNVSIDPGEPPPPTEA